MSQLCFTCGADITTRYDDTDGVCMPCEQKMGYGDFERGQRVQVSDEYVWDGDSSDLTVERGFIVARFPSGAFGVALCPDGNEPRPFALYAHEIEPVD